MNTKEHYRFFLVTLMLIVFFGFILVVRMDGTPQEHPTLPVAAARTQ